MVARGSGGGQTQVARHGQRGEGEEGEECTLAPPHPGPPGAPEGAVHGNLSLSSSTTGDIIREFGFWPVYPVRILL